MIKTNQNLDWVLNDMRYCPPEMAAEKMRIWFVKIQEANIYPQLDNNRVRNAAQQIWAAYISRLPDCPSDETVPKLVEMIRGHLEKDPLLDSLGT